MQTVIETYSYLDAAKDAGMSDEERELVVTVVASDPQISTVMQGTGGFRKFRHRKPGTG